MKEKPSILVTDDEPINIRIMYESLQADYDVIAAKNADETFGRLAQNDIDLILLDINLPDLDGVSICKKLKQNPQTKNIPVIFITANEQDNAEARGLEAGAVDYIRKPFFIPILKARIKTHIDLKRKTDILEQLASLDGLTGIANRRAFDERIDLEWRRAKRSNLPFSLIMLDVDFFKLYNDRYGHIKGDECLRTVAQSIREACSRAEDLPARYGGEEFAVILPNTPADAAYELCREGKSFLAEKKIPHENSTVAPIVTVSIGLACVREPSALNASHISVISAADKMLYSAKENGRNRIERIYL